MSFLVCYRSDTIANYDQLLLRQLVLITSCGGACPQKFEKRALTIFRLKPGPYKSAHQLDCSLLLPTAMANRVVSTQKIIC